MWQADAVKAKLEALGYTCQVVPIESTGDLQLTQPIYALGISGVFTKQLDAALIDEQADIAVHSLKDVPTQLAKKLFLAATLERGSHEDVAIYKNREILEDNLSEATIATSSLRRRAQWLEKYPKHTTVPVRGNVQTRLKRFEESREMDVIIFAKAGLERLKLLPQNAITLDWMLPAPAQGIVGVVCREHDNEIREICNRINYHESFIAGSVERQFLKTLMGGCSVPISALAEISGNELEFRGAIHAYDGTRHVGIHRVMLLSEWEDAGKVTAEKIMQRDGATQLLEEIRNKDWSNEGTLN